MTVRPYVLFAAPLSLYSGKARSYLRKAGLPFEERRPTHPSYLEEVLPHVDRFWLPVLQAPSGAVIQDTTEIIDYLEATHPETACAMPFTPRQRIVSLILELFGDEGLLRAAMHYRWNFLDHNGAFLEREFAHALTPPGPEEDRRAMAAQAMGRMKAYLPGLGITDLSRRSIEAAYMDLLQALDSHLATMPYLLGGRPTIGDFGLYGPLYAHLGRDPYPAFLMKQKARHVWRWVERMTVADPDMADFPHQAPDLLPHDEIPDTLYPVLSLIAADYLPELSVIAEAIDHHLDTTPFVETGAQVVGDGKPKSLGHVPMTLRGKPVEITVRYYAFWMLGRVQTAYDRLSPGDRVGVDRDLARSGLSGLMALRPRRSIERVGHREVWGPTRR